MMMFETSKHVPKTEERCSVFKDKKAYILRINKRVQLKVQLLTYRESY